jgi:hypothetical protein
MDGRKDMSFARRGRCALGMATALCLLATPASAGNPRPPVLEGGFRLFDPENPRENDAFMLSLGPLVGGTVRNRGAISGTDQCYEMLFALLGAKGTKRGPDSFSLAQKNHVVVFFVLYECDGEDEVCVVEASEPVAVAECSGGFALFTRRGIRGSVDVKCGKGIDVSDADFGLSPQSQALLSGALPDLGRPHQIKYSDPRGEEVTGPDLEFKIRNVDVDALDDIVGAFLDDDDLPDCD